MIVESFLIILYIGIYIFATDICMKALWKIGRMTPPGENQFLSIFYNSLLFSLVAITLVATARSGGRTIFVMALPCFYFLYKLYTGGQLNNPSPAVPVISKLNVWGSVLVLIVISTIASYYFSLKFSMRNDVAHYTKISECVVNQGIENPYHYYNDENPVFHGNIPYHYFEMWFGGCVFFLNRLVHFTGLSNMMIYIYIVYNLFRTLVFIGLFGLIQKYTKFSANYFVICIPLLMLDISAFFTWWNEAFIAESNFFERPNFIFYYVFLVPVFDGILNRNTAQVMAWSSIFCICTITALPAIGGCVFLFLAFDLMFKESRKRTALYASCFSTFVFLIVVFYKVFGASSLIMPVESYSPSEIIAKTAGMWKACVYMFLILFIKVALCILFGWMLMKVFVKNRPEINYSVKSLILYVTCINIAGIGLFQAVPYIDNMYQFTYIGYCAVVLLLGFILVLVLGETRTIPRLMFAGTVAAVLVWGIRRNLFYDHIIVQKIAWKRSLSENFLSQYNLSDTYIQALKRESKDLTGKHGASIIDGKDALNEFLGLRFSAIYQLGFYLMAFNNHVHLPLLSDPATLYPDQDTLSKDYYKAKYFNQFTEFYRACNQDRTYKENLESYISTKKIKFFFASSSLGPYDLFDRSKIARVVRDSNKGHQLVILK